MSAIFRVGSSVLLRSSSASCQVTAPALMGRSSCWLQRAASSNPAAGQVVPGEDYFTKNNRLKRPLSPHLTIYKPQLTSMLSITHRGTGIVLAGMLSTFSIGMLFLPATYPYYIGLLYQTHYGVGAIFGAKFFIAFPFCFHAFNGVRHLFWDLGYGFSLRDLYKSGYTVLGLAVIAGLGLASL